LEAENAALRTKLKLPPKNAGQFAHAALAGAQGQGRSEHPAQEQDASRRASRAAPEPDAAVEAVAERFPTAGRSHRT